MRTKRGFTLIELLVVIAIIAILATLVITQLSGARVKARNANAKSDVSEAGKAIELFKVEQNSLDDVIAAGAIPTSKPANGLTGGSQNCSYKTGATTNLAGCWTSVLIGSTNAPSNGYFAGIFSGTSTAVVGNLTGATQAGSGAPKSGWHTAPTGNHYGLKFPDVPGAGYEYYYMSFDIGAALPVNHNTLSSSGNYYFVADLGVSGASQDGVSRYYYVHNSVTGNVTGKPKVTDQAAAGDFLFP